MSTSALLKRFAQYIRTNYDEATYLKWKKHYVGLKSRFYHNNLNKLATINYTDKWNSHWYTQHYNRHFRPFKNKRLNVLEIGIGGYERPEKGGNSLRMWKAYFKNSNIYAIDIYDKSPHDEARIKTFKGSQVDDIFLKQTIEKIGDIDIIIDDGSHINEHVIHTFQFLFPLLKEGGIYAVEDMQTSYWPEYGGNSLNLNDNKTMMSFFKGLIDGLNHEEFVNTAYKSDYYAQNIISIHFYHNMIFIHKGKNNEGSNLVENGQFKEKII